MAEGDGRKARRCAGFQQINDHKLNYSAITAFAAIRKLGGDGKLCILSWLKPPNGAAGRNSFALRHEPRNAETDSRGHPGRA